MDIAEQLNNTTEIRVPAVTEREGAIIAYRLILTAMLREIRAEYRSTVLPSYREHRQFVADESAWFDRLKQVAAGAVSNAVVAFGRLAGSEADSFDRRFKANLRRATRVDINGLSINLGRREQRLMTDYVQRNASLIQNLSDDAVKRIEQAVFAAKLGNQPLGDLSRQIQTDFRILRSRADLIAVDQIASLNADLTQIHHRSVGINQYRWVTRRDERVRDLHRPLNGKTYKYGQRTGAENGLPPGKPIRCRCVAEGIIQPKRRLVASAIAGFVAGAFAAELAAGDPDDQ